VRAKIRLSRDDALRIVQSACVTYTRPYVRGACHMRSIFLVIGRTGCSAALCLLTMLDVQPAAAQMHMQGADPTDAFGTIPNTAVCPRTKPFKCESGDCVTNPTKCKSTGACPADIPLRCTNGTCVSTPSDCEISTRCPPPRPVRCPQGACVATRDDCPVLGLDN
jgi:hypothetical protein